MNESPAPGWYPDPDGKDTLRYWDGQRWTGQIAPPTSADLQPVAKTVIWTLALACGVAGALAWGAPVIAFYWPMGFGGAGMALSFVAYQLRGETPWWAIVAVVASIAALLMGIGGYQDLEDTRRGLLE